MVLEAIRYRTGSLQVLDQLKLPHQEVYDHVNSAQDAWSAIKEMRVRGAPAIAIVAALALAVEIHNQPEIKDSQLLKNQIHEKLDYLNSSRPTAVNLGNAVKQLKGVVDEAEKASGAQAVFVQLAYIKAAEQMLIDDVQDNKAIGFHGAAWISGQREGLVSVVTHCNTGSLATAGYGTALGVVRSLHEGGHLKHAYCTETRPYNQGSRLTAFELVHDKIPSTLVTDSMASALLQLKGPGDNIAAIVVGADRVAANGDTANKIGTYNLAITARFHGVKFLVAAPRTTIDLQTASGASIKIEERAAHELTTISGPKMRGAADVDLSSPAEKVSIAANGIGVWNPAFDVTPAELIDGIVTEVGVAEKNAAGTFDLREIMSRPRPQAANGA